MTNQHTHIHSYANEGTERKYFSFNLKFYILNIVCSVAAVLALVDRMYATSVNEENQVHTTFCNIYNLIEHIYIYIFVMTFEAQHNIRIQYFRLFIVYYECATKSGSRRKICIMCQNFDYTYS